METNNLLLKKGPESIPIDCPGLAKRLAYNLILRRILSGTG